MKKIFLMLLGIAATINAMAIDYTAQAMITITSSTGYYNSMIVQEAAIYGNSIAGAEMNLEGNGAFLYGINGSTKLQVVRGADLEGVQLGVKTDAGTEFTFTVSSVEGSNPLYFMDALGENHALTEGASFTIYNLAANSTIEDRFTLGRPSAPTPVYAAEVTTNEYGLATFSHASDLAPVEAGVKLYKGAVSGETLVLTPVADIAAGQGVIVYGEANTTYHFNVINGATADFAGNELLAASAWFASHDGYDIYVLSGNALYLYEGTDFPANKAFLKIAQSVNPSPRRIRLVFDQATAIDNISADNVKAEKVVENGQILIRRGNEVYNLQGQIVK